MIAVDGHSSGEDRIEDLVADASRRIGVDFTGSRGPWLRSAVQRALGPAPADAVGRLGDDEVFRRFCDDVTVQESFFFRERARLDVVAQVVLPALRARSAPVSVWSAGCAAGQEAYTLAALLRQAGLSGGYRVLGTDLSSAAVAAAQEGEYTTWSLRGLDEAETARYFTTTRSGVRVRDELRDGVSFRQHNLLESPPAPPGGFDLVLCRNVLIYLTADATRAVARHLSDALGPGGWLVTSASDPLLDDVEGLEPVLTEHGLAYRRAGAPCAPRVSLHAAALPRRGNGLGGQRRTRSAIGPPLTRPPLAGPAIEAVLADGQRALHLADHRGAEGAARRVLLEGAGDSAAAAHSLLVQALAGGGEPERAREAAQAAVAAFPLDASLRHLQAVVLLHAGLPTEAAVAARSALYLDPELAAAHFVLARCHDLQGSSDAADRSRRSALGLLGQVPG